MKKKNNLRFGWKSKAVMLAISAGVAAFYYFTDIGRDIADHLHLMDSYNVNREQESDRKKDMGDYIAHIEKDGNCIATIDNAVKDDGRYNPSRRAIFLSDRLFVNEDDSKAMIVHKDEEEGIKDIRKLVFDAKGEDSWVYLPDKMMWEETGIESVPPHKITIPKASFLSIYMVSVNIDMSLMQEIMKSNDNIAVYHFHMPNPFEDFIRESNTNLENLARDINNDRLKDILLGNIPSYHDIRSMIWLSLEFYDHNPKGRMEFKVAVSEGVIDFHLTEKGISYFRKKDGECRGAWAYALDSVRYDGNLKLDDPLNKENAVRNICNAMSNDMIQFNFTPYEDNFLEKK